METEELISRRWLGHFLVAVNLSATFAYNIVCKRKLKSMDLQASALPPCQKPVLKKTETASAERRRIPQQRVRAATVPAGRFFF